MADPGGFLGFRETPLFIVLHACVTGLVHVHERSQNVLGQQNHPFQNPRSATEKVCECEIIAVWARAYALTLHTYVLSTTGN